MRIKSFNALICGAVAVKCAKLFWRVTAVRLKQFAKMRTVKVTKLRHNLAYRLIGLL